MFLSDMHLRGYQLPAVGSAWHSRHVEASHSVFTAMDAFPSVVRFLFVFHFVRRRNFVLSSESVETESHSMLVCTSIRLAQRSSSYPNFGAELSMLHRR